MVGHALIKLLIILRKQDLFPMDKVKNDIIIIIWGAQNIDHFTLHYKFNIWCKADQLFHILEVSCMTRTAYWVPIRETCVPQMS